GDLAPHLFDDGLELGGQFFDLLRAGVLAREEDVFVEWHPMPFPCSLLHPARSPSSPFGKGSNAQKAGTRDAGPSALPPGIGQAAVRSVPSRDRAEARVIGSFGEKARRPLAAQDRPAAPARLDRGGGRGVLGPVSWRGGNVVRFRISGPRQPGRWHGQGPRRRLWTGTRGV